MSVMKITFLPKEPTAKNIAIVKLVKQPENEVVQLEHGQRHVIIGIGSAVPDRRKLVLIARQIVATARRAKIKKFAISFKDFAVKEKLDDSRLAELIAANFELANFEFIRYKTKPKEGWNFVEQIIVTGAVSVAAKKGFVRGQTIGQQVNACRELANIPGGEMTPALLAVAAKKAAQKTAVRVKVLDEKQIKQLKMGGLLGVSKGSSEKPRFIIMEYRKGGREKPIVLVGKGVTFDSGGLNIKPEMSMNDMHMDMSGGAAVIHTIVLAAKLRLKKNVIALIPAVENMISGSSYRPGDVLRSMSGKTIEVQNTDAEGRIILADALHYAKRYKPSLVVDVATLTGAAMVALGERATEIGRAHV